MATLRPGSTVTVREVDGGVDLTVGDDRRGRLRGSEVTFDDRDMRVQRTGERFELVTSTGIPVLRFDPAGAKATTLTTSSGRFRLARLRPRPLQHRWQLTRDVHGAALLTITGTPLGTRLRTADEPGVTDGELALLALGALVEVLDVEPAAAPVA